MKIFGDPTQTALHQGMHLLSRRQEATVANIANVDTPGYKAKVVSFDHEMARLLGGNTLMFATHRDHIQAVSESPSVVVRDALGGRWRNDGNSVDVERELASLAETTITYGALTQQAGARYALIRRVITEGRSP